MEGKRTGRWQSREECGCTPAAWVAGDLARGPERLCLHQHWLSWPRSDGTGRTGGRKHDKRYHLFVLERNTLQAPPFLPISPPTRLLAPLFSRLLPSLLPEPPPASASPVEEPVGPERLGKEQTWAGEAPRKQRHFQYHPMCTGPRLLPCKEWGLRGTGDLAR